MESNGKRVKRDGSPVDTATSPIVFGEPGTNGQHAFFQQIHQGPQVVPAEFIAVRQAEYGPAALPEVVKAALADQHIKLLSNCLAQSQALMLGKTTEEALAEKAPTASKSLGALTVARHRTFPGNRPSSTLLLERLTPRSLGALIALYEHRVWTSGALWGINSFDQWGVELGKALPSQARCRNPPPHPIRPDRRSGHQRRS
jgi:glucose-6-phosphate isomerase